MMKDPVETTFGEYLDDLLRQKKFTAKELASLIGIDAATVSRWRNNKEVPAPDSNYLQRIVSFLALTEEEKRLLRKTYSYSLMRMQIEKLPYDSKSKSDLAGGFWKLIPSLPVKWLLSLRKNLTLPKPGGQREDVRSRQFRVSSRSVAGSSPPTRQEGAVDTTRRGARLGTKEAAKGRAEDHLVEASDTVLQGSVGRGDPTGSSIEELGTPRLDFDGGHTPLSVGSAAHQAAKGTAWEAARDHLASSGGVLLHIGAVLGSLFHSALDSAPELAIGTAVNWLVNRILSLIKLAIQLLIESLFN